MVTRRLPHHCSTLVDTADRSAVLHSEAEPGGGSKHLWEAPVAGDCMADEIQLGEVVIYNDCLSAAIGKVMVALRDEEELIIKRLRLAGDKQVLRPNHGKDVLVDERIRFLVRGVSVQRPLL